MITGSTFIWLHFPKCAGTEISRCLEENFGNVDGIVFDRDSGTWHNGLSQRKAQDESFSWEQKCVICCFRRLPSWLLSRVYYEMSRTPELIVTREMFERGEFYESTGVRINADWYAKKFAEHVDRWIRVENLVDDFTAAFSDHLPLAKIDLHACLGRYTNRTKLQYVRDPRFFFTPAQLVALYAANPFWAKLEAELYGSTYTFGP